MKIKDFQMLRLIKAKLLWPKVGEDNEGKDLEDVKNKTQNSFNIFWTGFLLLIGELLFVELILEELPWTYLNFWNLIYFCFRVFPKVYKIKSC